MLSAPLYQPIYLLIVTLLTLLVRSRYTGKTIGKRNKNFQDDMACLFIVISLTLFIGLRPPSGYYFGDTSNYVWVYNGMEGGQFIFDFSIYDPIFNNIFNWWAANSLGYDTFFVFIAFIYFGCTYLGVRRLFPEHHLAAYIVFLAAFSTFSYSTNGIRAGAAAAIFIWAISYYKKIYICLPLALVSLGVHHGQQLPLAALIITYLYKNTKHYFYIWIFCLLMAVAHVEFFANIFASMSDESGAEYLRAEGADSFKSGFRPDFILYSAMPVLVGYYVILKRKIKVSKLYSSLLNLYLLTNGVWMLCMYASYTNRIAYLSWFMYPIVLVYPFLQENLHGMKLLNTRNQYRMFAKVMMYHLAFTLFMEFFYYRILF